MDSREPSPRSLVAEAKGRRASDALQFIEAPLKAREEEIIASVMKVLKDGEVLEDRYAVQQWIAMNEVKSLRSSLEALSTKGQRAAQRNAHLRTPIG